MRPAQFAVLSAGLLACSDKPGANVDAMTDAGGPRMVTGRDVVRNIINTATRTPVVVDDVPVRSLEVTQLLPDGTTAPVTVAADGTFSFAAEADWRALVAIDGGAPAEYQLGSDKLELSVRLAGRYDRAAVPAGTTLNVSVTGAPGGGTAMIATTGLWTQTGRTGGSNGNFTIDWTAAASLSGSPGLIDAGQYDRVYYTTIEATGSSPQYQTITSSCSSDITMTGGTANTLTCGATPVMQNRCVHLVAPEGMETARIGNATVTAPALPYFSGYWVTAALPVPALGPVAPLWLAYHIPAPGMTTPADVDREVTFGNPYPGHDVTVVMVAQRYRTYAFGSATATTVGATTLHYVRAEADCTTPTTIPQKVAIPSLPSLDGIQLANDATSLGLDRTRFHTLTWDVGAPGDVDFWSVRLYEATVSAMNATQLALRHSYVTVDRKVVVDPALLEVGKTYFIETVAIVANPNARDGDFDHVSYPATPYAVASVMSAAFRIDE